MMARSVDDKINERQPPFETADLRENLVRFLDTPFAVQSGRSINVGNDKWGVYAFYDYDGEPIHVGKTNEKLRTRIRRHLTKQRTDTVAMSVLGPFEVLKIKMWSLPEYQSTSGGDIKARSHLNALEQQVTATAVKASAFQAILNEKNPPAGTITVDIPPRFAARSCPTGSCKLDRIQISERQGARSSLVGWRRSSQSDRFRADCGAFSQSRPPVCNGKPNAATTLWVAQRRWQNRMMTNHSAALR